MRRPGGEISDAEIRELGREAAQAGDFAQVLLCRAACGDYETMAQHEIAEARACCADILNDGRAYFVHWTSVLIALSLAATQ